MLKCRHLRVRVRAPNATTRRRRRRRRGRGTMKRGRRMSNLPLHQRTLGRRIQGRNPRREGSLPFR